MADVKLNYVALLPGKLRVKRVAATIPHVSLRFLPLTFSFGQPLGGHNVRLAKSELQQEQQLQQQH